MNGDTLAGDAHLVDELERAIDAAPSPPRWRRADVPRELLVKPTVGGLLAEAGREWAALAALWAAMALTPVGWWWAQLPLTLLVAGRIHAFGVILHDATHMPLRHKTPAVRLLEALVGYPVATTLNAMRYHHLRHHRDSGMPTDPYFKAGVDERRGVWLVQWLRGLLLLPFWTVRAPYGLVASFVPALLPSYARVFLQDRSGRVPRGGDAPDDATFEAAAADRSGDDLRASREVQAAARAELGQVLFQIPLFAAFALWPEAMLRGYALPATITGLLASYRVLCEHRYQPTRDRRVDTVLATTRDHHLGLWGKLLFAPRNIGYHVVHHLHPQVAGSRLPELRAWYLARHGAGYGRTPDDTAP